jgi:uncharacterized membrane protein
MQFQPRRLGSIFLTGLIVLLPVTVTVVFLWWLLTTAEEFFGALITPWLGDWYRPGMGMGLGVVLVFVTGLLAQVWFIRQLLGWGDSLLERIPLIKTIYGGVRDILELFQTDPNKRFQKVVRVRWPGTDMYLIGFVTREDFSGLPDGIAGPDMVAVYLPTSYNIGGYTLIMPRALLEPLDMSFEDAMRFAVTAGLSVGEHKHGAPSERPAANRRG